MFNFFGLFGSKKKKEEEKKVSKQRKKQKENVSNPSSSDLKNRVQSQERLETTPIVKPVSPVRPIKKEEKEELQQVARNSFRNGSLEREGLSEVDKVQKINSVHRVQTLKNSEKNISKNIEEIPLVVKGLEGLKKDFQNLESPDEKVKILKERVQNEALEIEADEIIELAQSLKYQRWWFIKNRQILFDSRTGYVWPDLNNFKLEEMELFIAENRASQMLWNGIPNWKIPFRVEVIEMLDDRRFPFCSGFGAHKIQGIPTILIKDYKVMFLDENYPGTKDGKGYFIPCSIFYSEEYKEKVLIHQNREEFLPKFFKENIFIPTFKNQKSQYTFNKISNIARHLNEIAEIEGKKSSEYLRDKNFKFSNIEFILNEILS